MRRLRVKMLRFLKQGTTPHDLALALALGAVLGTFPVIGATSALCMLAGVFLRLNPAAIQSMNWAATPLQLALLVPFFELGSVLFGTGSVNVDPASLVSMMRNDFFGTIGRFLVITTHAVWAWALVAPPLGLLVYLTLLPLTTRMLLMYAQVCSDEESS